MSYLKSGGGGKKLQFYITHQLRGDDKKNIWYTQIAKSRPQTAASKNKHIFLAYGMYSPGTGPPWDRGREAYVEGFGRRNTRAEAVVGLRLVVQCLREVCPEAVFTVVYDPEHGQGVVAPKDAVVADRDALAMGRTALDLHRGQ